ncbi:MAG TPA: rhodanese-like domain-containing protein [Phycisphaerales bacterium]|nr:rhodanese-like domain-containing protein [Phycisphaerales bacterium]
MTTVVTQENPATNAPGGGAREASALQIRDWLRNGECVLVDVREPDEHAREHIGQARIVPLSRFDAAEAARGVNPGQRLVLHCKSGKRSADAARLAVGRLGPGTPVVSMSGGIEAWKGAGLPVVTNASVSGISVMRQVQLVIGVGVLVGCALAWLVHPGFLAIPAFFGAGLVFAGASGTCGLAAILGKMPWNRAGKAGASCSTGGCG